jgi:aminopeptidase YwaD
MNNDAREKAESYLNELCLNIGNRSVGSNGNRQATDFFEKEISSSGWEITKNELNAMDWENGGAAIRIEGKNYEALVSPYSMGCNVEAQLVCIASTAELEETDTDGKIVLLHGEIARGQLMPKNFVFYNPDEHKKIVSLLESKGIKAIISVTGRNSALAGGVYPFPLIEDGDFDIPSVYLAEEEGNELLKFNGKPVRLSSVSTRIRSKCYNIIAKKGKGKAKIVVTAHIDAKKTSPGAIDNATGVIVLLLLAGRLKEYNGDTLIEIVPFNGEDYYAVPGQMDYIKRNEGEFENILLNINIDGAGYKEGESALSLYNMPGDMERIIKDVLSKSSRVVEGTQWPQGDHSIFVQFGRPALAATSKWFTDNMETQTITHTPKDSTEIVDCSKLIDITDALYDIISGVIAMQEEKP